MTLGPFFSSSACQGFQITISPAVRVFSIKNPAISKCPHAFQDRLAFLIIDIWYFRLGGFFGFVKFTENIGTAGHLVF